MTINIKIGLIIAILLFSIGLVSASTTVNLNPTDDTYSYFKYPNNNYGNSAWLVANENNTATAHTYLHFAIETVNITSSDVLEANIWVYGNYDDSYTFIYGGCYADGSYGETPTNNHCQLTARELSAAFNEHTLTWNNAPASGSIIGTSDEIRTHWVAIPVTQTIKDWYDTPADNYGFNISITSDYLQSMQAEMYSKEVYAGEEAFRPYLQITYGEPGYTTSDKLVYYYGDEAVFSSYSVYPSYLTIYAPKYNDTTVIVYDGIVQAADTNFTSYLYIHDTAPTGKYHFIHRGFDTPSTTTWVSSGYFNVIGERLVSTTHIEGDNNSLLAVGNELSVELLGDTDTDNSGDFSSSEIASRFSGIFLIVIACIILSIVAAVYWKFKGKKEGE